MKKFALNAEARPVVGKKSLKALRAEGKIPAVLNGGKIVDLPFTGTLKPGERIVEIDVVKDAKGRKVADKNLKKNRGVITTDIAVKEEDVRKLIYTPDIFEIDMTLNGESRKAVMKELQFQPVKDNVLHIDFLEVGPEKPIVMEVPVKIEGHAEGVKAGGKLQLSMRKLKVKAIYDQIPERLVVNVDNLGLGKSIQVGDLHFDGLELINAKNAVVCAVQLTRAARGAQAKAEG
ncbi:MAG: 50S ribosomal protein L25 [Muribaculaceae bacterium]|nr:50S ribosomal protein L25 [Muribaculaceae bacterium]